MIELDGRRKFVIPSDPETLNTSIVISQYNTEDSGPKFTFFDWDENLHIVANVISACGDKGIVVRFAGTPQEIVALVVLFYGFHTGYSLEQTLSWVESKGIEIIESSYLNAVKEYLW